MSMVFQDWMVSNTQRKYPLDDFASGVDDHGGLVREDVLADLHLLLPQGIGYAFVSSMSVTAGAVSITISGAATPAVPSFPGDPFESPVFTPLALVSLDKPVTPFRNYPLTPVTPGVRGWVAFGGCVTSGDVTYHRMSTPAQAAICPKAIQVTTAAPVQSFRAGGEPNFLHGDVGLRVDSPLELRQAQMRILDPLTQEDLGTVDAFVISLSDTLKNLKEFSGQCQTAAYLGGCSRIPIAAINGVAPDSFGNIEIEIEDPCGLTSEAVTDGAGIVLMTHLDMHDVCAGDRGLPSMDGTLPNKRPVANTCGTPAAFSGSSLGSGISPDNGSWFDDPEDNDIKGVPLPNGVAIGSAYVCHPGAASQVWYRTFRFAYTVPPEVSKYGIRCLQRGSRFVYVAHDGKIYGYAGGAYALLGTSSGTPPTSVEFRITRKGQLGEDPQGDPLPATDLFQMTTGDTTVEFNTAELRKYWAPDGTCKFYCEGSPYGSGLELPIDVAGVDPMKTPKDEFISVTEVAVNDTDIPGV